MPLPRLSDRTLARAPHGAWPAAYERASVEIGVAHLGPGAFHRAHQAPVFDTLLADDPRCGLCEIALRSDRVRDALDPQDGLYTLVELDSEPRMRIVGPIKQVLTAADSPGAVLQRLAAVRTRMITLTVTEKGYCLTPAGAARSCAPGCRRRPCAARHAAERDRLAGRRAAAQASGRRRRFADRQLRQPHRQRRQARTGGRHASAGAGRCGSRGVDRGRGALSGHYGGQHHAGHGRGPARTGARHHRAGRRLAGPARALHPVGDRGPAWTGRAGPGPGGRAAGGRRAPVRAGEAAAAQRRALDAGLSRDCWRVGGRWPRRWRTRRWPGSSSG